MSTMQPAGPGPYTKRTDRQGAKRLPNAAYGEQKEFQNQQMSAPMAKSGGARPSMNDLMANIVPFNAPTQRPDELVTAGVDDTPGPGSEILGLNKSQADAQLEDLGKLGKYLPLMVQFADSPQSSGTMKAFVKYLRSQQE